MLNNKSVHDQPTATSSLSGEEYALLEPLMIEGAELKTGKIPASVATHSSMGDGDDETIQSELVFEKGTRGQVNGAAAVFGTAGLLLGGPILGVVAAAGCAHAAARKTGTFADLTRQWGGIVTNYAREKRWIKAKQKSQDQKDQRSLWDKITDGLLHSADWVEKRIAKE